MSDDSEKKTDSRPKYKHEGGKCDHRCTYYEHGYCKLTGAYMVPHNNLIGATRKSDCEPYIVDLRRDAKKGYPQYHNTADLAGDEETAGELLDELHSLAHGAHDFLESIDGNMKALLQEFQNYKKRMM